MASFFHVTHLITLSETALDTPYMRICRLPQGPTLSFKYVNFIILGLGKIQVISIFF